MAFNWTIRVVRHLWNSVLSIIRRLLARWAIEFSQILNRINYALSWSICIKEDAVSVLRRWASDAHDLLLFRCRHDWILLRCIVISFLVNATILCSKTLLFEFPHLALVIFKVAETFLAFSNTNVIVVPRIRKISLSFPVVSIATWHLIRLRHAFPMVELLIEINHASC